MELMEQILKLLGGIVIVGGGSGVVTYGLLKYFGKKWIDIKFAQQLEGFKHDQAKEIQRLSMITSIPVSSSGTRTWWI